MIFTWAIVSQYFTRIIKGSKNGYRIRQTQESSRRGITSTV